ncbi:MAG TPA: NAD(P)-dependent oxidoreductase, partial [Nannocystis sp.]
MAELRDKRCLIAGGTGGVGEGIVRAFLNAGATVFVPSRSAAKLDALAGSIAAKPRDRLVTL